jgi:hypothetical protein
VTLVDDGAPTRTGGKAKVATYADLFRALAEEHGLHVSRGVNPRYGWPESGLYGDASANPLYRYAYAIWWGSPTVEKSAAWVLCNPATGDTDRQDRPTLTSCVKRTRYWPDLGGLIIVNLFAHRDRDPKTLRNLGRAAVGPANDSVIRAIAAASDRTVVAWGGRGKLLGRAAAVRSLLPESVHYIPSTAKQPHHPLYVPLGEPQPYRLSGRSGAETARRPASERHLASRQENRPLSSGPRPPRHARTSPQPRGDLAVNRKNRRGVSITFDAEPEPARELANKIVELLEGQPGVSAWTVTTDMLAVTGPGWETAVGRPDPYIIESWGRQPENLSNRRFSRRSAP